RVVKRRVARKALAAMKERVRIVTKRTRGRSIEQVARDLRSYLVGWKAYFRLADTPRIFSDLDEWIRHRLRAIHLKHWKRGRTIYRELRSRGLSEAGARRVAANGRRWWRNSGMLINVAFPIRYFDGRGVPRLAALHPRVDPSVADPHAGWCGRGPEGLPRAPKPICGALQAPPLDRRGIPRRSPHSSPPARNTASDSVFR